MPVPVEKHLPPIELSKQQKEAVILIGMGLTDAEIAEKMEISKSTAIKHSLEARRKLGLNNRTKLVIFCYENNLLPKDANKEYRKGVLP